MASRFKYSWESGLPHTNLPRVSWYASKFYGHDRLYGYLYNIFNADYPLTDTHRFFANLPRKLRDKKYPRKNQLIVTTNYDDLLERAFDEAGEPYDVLTYLATTRVSHDMRYASKFKHFPHGGEPTIVKLPNQFLPSTEHTTILKIHGAVDRANWESSSFVITEDDYLNYLSNMDSDDIYKIPSSIVQMMRNKSFLFLGYSLGDWNLRVLLKRISENRLFDFRSFAIMKDPKEWDPVYWDHHQVHLQTLPLDQYIRALEQQLDSLPEFEGERF